MKSIIMPGHETVSYIPKRKLNGPQASILSAASPAYILGYAQTDIFTLPVFHSSQH